MGISAEDLLNDLAGVQKFLHEFKNTVSHQVFSDALKAQVLGLTSKLARVGSLKPEQATAILVALRTGPWTEEHLGALSQSISACIAATTTTKKKKPSNSKSMKLSVAGKLAKQKREAKMIVGSIAPVLAQLANVSQKVILPATKTDAKRKRLLITAIIRTCMVRLACVVVV